VCKEFWASYLELFLKLGEPPTKDENFLRAIIDILKLLASIVILLYEQQPKKQFNGGELSLRDHDPHLCCFWTSE